MRNLILIYCFSLSILSFNFGQQSNLINQEVSVFLPPNSTISDALDFLEQEYNISFSYSNSQFNGKSKAGIISKNVSLKQALKTIFYRYNITAEQTDATKIVLTASLKRIRVFGYIRDVYSSETITGPLIINQNTQEVHLPNGDGYYSITSQEENIKLETRLLGYFPDTTFLVHNGEDIRKDIFLKFSNQMSPIIVRNNVADKQLLDPGTIIIDPSNGIGIKNISGEKDLINIIRNEPGITSGGEGILGLNVNGGDIDQNLILIDGMPLYETSHIAGINSIFLEESIKSVDMTRTGIPARYGGKLSSVVNVSLKEGHKESPKRSVSLGFTGARFGFEGPINKSQKTTFNIAGRTSLINYFINPIVNKFTNFEDINLSFNDLIGKCTHRFNNRSKLSISGYLGGDRTKLTQDDTIRAQSYYYQKRDINEINWGNRMLNLNYHNILSSKATMHFQLGWSAFNFNSRGFYELESKSDSVDISRKFDVRTKSSINDIQLISEFDYYYNDFIKAKVGLGAIAHRFSPTVQQSVLTQFGEESTFSNPDNTINSMENFVYGELNIQLGKYMFIYPGLHINNYNVENTNHLTIQPRFRTMIIPSLGTVISFSYSKLAQNVHLLSNPGIGLPSDLWIPSTSSIKPTTNNQIDLEFKQNLANGFNIAVSWYQKSYKDLIVYSKPIDLHANIVVDGGFQIFFDNESDWRKEVQSGSGTSRGYTVSIKKESGKLKGWITYHHNKSIRNFANIDNGETFLAKNDMPHDLDIALNYEISSKFKIGTNWSYTSGGLFSLPNEKFKTSLGIEVIKPDARNNNRLPAFHQLSVSGEKSFTLLGTAATINFGLYNAYNRLNPFYLYVTNDPDSTVPVIKKVSIFPVMPFFNINWKW